MKTIFSPVKVIGLDRIDTSKPHVYAVNHASALDIPVLYVNLPFQFRIAFKKELLSYPVVGWQLKRSGQICIDQQNPSRSIGSIRAALKGLKGRIAAGDFSRGRTHARWRHQAVSCREHSFWPSKRRWILCPLRLVGTYELLPMNTYHIKCRPLEMRVGRADPDNRTDDTGYGSFVRASAEGAGRFVLPA